MTNMKFEQTKYSTKKDGGCINCDRGEIVDYSTGDKEFPYEDVLVFRIGMLQPRICKDCAKELGKMLLKESEEMK